MTIYSKKVMDAVEIRDTNPRDSDVVKAGVRLDIQWFMVVENSLDKQASVQVYGAMDPTNGAWHSIGSAVVAAAKSGQNPGLGQATTGDPWQAIKATVTCSQSPTNGGITIWIAQS